MSDAVRRVLDHIVSTYVVQEEVRSIDRDAPNNSDGDAIETDKIEAIRREEDRAHHLASSFEAGLHRAWHRARMGGHEIALDDRKQDENRIADALIQLLVRFDFAASRTEQTDSRHYIYHISVNWDRLRQIADEADVDLDGVLAAAEHRANR
ncbi:MAG TPA: hypothetical protein VGR08_00585 [Thermomicrobiales bacterium]|nr:hypothetical protein [Thermomicrobiales bacterium]